MEDKTEGILLKCNHLFCQPCIKQWLTNNKSTCPTCRKEVEI